VSFEPGRRPGPSSRRSHGYRDSCDCADRHDRASRRARSSGQGRRPGPSSRRSHGYRDSHDCASGRGRGATLGRSSEPGGGQARVRVEATVIGVRAIVLAEAVVGAVRALQPRVRASRRPRSRGPTACRDPRPEQSAPIAFRAHPALNSHESGHNFEGGAHLAERSGCRDRLSHRCSNARTRSAATVTENLRTHDTHRNSAANLAPSKTRVRRITTALSAVSMPLLRVGSRRLCRLRRQEAALKRACITSRWPGNPGTRNEPGVTSEGVENVTGKRTNLGLIKEPEELVRTSVTERTEDYDCERRRTQETRQGEDQPRITQRGEAATGWQIPLGSKESTTDHTDGTDGLENGAGRGNHETHERHEKNSDRDLLCPAF
jgi:hypothetical protein